MRAALRVGVACGVALGAAGTVWGQPLQFPPGKWWERPRVVEELALTQEQRSKLDAVTMEHARTMVDLKAAVEKAELDLRAAADSDPFDAARVRGAFGALQQARARLEGERFEMLLEVRQVLTTEQWTKLKGAVRERLGAAVRGEREPLGGREAPFRPRRPRRF
ncbi:MAG: periplasmic heavy metal sensor [Acidobacteriota bacterium]